MASPITLKTVLEQSDTATTGGGTSSVAAGGGVASTPGATVVPLDASSAPVTETLPSGSDGTRVVAVRTDTASANTATLEVEDTSTETIERLGEQDGTTVDLGVEQALYLVYQNNAWHEVRQLLRAAAEPVTTDGGTKDSPSVQLVGTYDEDGSTSVTSAQREATIRHKITGIDTSTSPPSPQSELAFEIGGAEVATIDGAGNIVGQGDVSAFGASSGSGGSTGLAGVDPINLNATPDPSEVEFIQDIEDNSGNTVVQGATEIQFKGSGLGGVTNPSGDRVEVEITGGGTAIDVEDDGVQQVTGVETLDFATGLDVSNPTAGEASVDVNLGHSDLSGISSGDHHARYGDTEAVAAVNAETTLSVDISGDADSVDGYQGSELAALAENETVDGQYAFKGDILFNRIETDGKDPLFLKWERPTNNKTRFVFGRNMSFDSSDQDLAVMGRFPEGWNFGLRTTNPQFPLDVAGQVRAQDGLRTSGWRIYEDGNDNLRIEDTNDSSLGFTLTSGAIEADNDVAAFGSSGGSGGGGSSFQPGRSFGVTDSTTDPDTFGVTLAAGTGISLNSPGPNQDYKITHAETSTQGDVTTTKAAIVDGVFLDPRGHVTAIETRTLAHSDLSITSSDHHTRYADSEAVSAVNAETSLSVDITGDADSVDGYQGSELAALAENETISGQYTFTSVVGIGQDPGTEGGGIEGLEIAATKQQLRLSDTQNSNFWQYSASGGSFVFRYNEGITGEQEVWRSDTSGNNGFKGASPSYAVDAAGQVRAQSGLRVSTTSGDYEIQGDGSGNLEILTPNGNRQKFFNDGDIGAFQ